MPTELQNAQILKALTVLMRWATHGDKSGNPYRHPEVMAAYKALQNAGIQPYAADPTFGKKKFDEYIAEIRA
jgi:hypothetical protein